MVRFHWPCDAGQNSFVPQGGVEQDEKNGVTHVHCEMELSGQNETCPALFTMPSTYLEEGSIKNIGLIMAHGTNAEDSKGHFFTEMATHFAQKGYLVMRYYCKQKEQRRQRIFERSADTAAASPYARNVKHWIYIGHENGARIAALVGYKSAKPKAGFIFISYPLMEPAPPPPKQKAGAEPPADSLGPLLKLIEHRPSPILFINGEFDYNCPGSNLKDLAPAFERASIDTRCIIFPELDAKLAPLQDNASISTETIASVEEAIEKFIVAVDENRLDSLDIPKLMDIKPSERVPPRPEVAAQSEEDEEEEEDEEQQQQDINQQTRGHTPNMPDPALSTGAKASPSVGRPGGLDPGSIPPGVTPQQIMLMQQRAMANMTPAQIQQIQLAFVQRQMAMAAAGMRPMPMGGQQQPHNGGGGGAGQNINNSHAP